MLNWRADCIRKRIESLSREIERVTRKHHAYATPKLVYRALSAVLAKIDADVTKARALYGGLDDEFDRRLFATALTTAEEDVSSAVKLFSNCDRVDSSRVPFEILAALTTTAQDLLAAPCLLVLHLTSDYNYKIYSCRAWFDAAKWPSPWPTSQVSDILILVFPSYEVSNVELHAAAAHELGHVLTAQLSAELADIVIPAVRARHLESPEEKVLAVAERTIKVPGAGDVLLDTAWEEIKERLFAVPVQWVIETTADLIAARLVGPAFMAALERITLAAANASDSHPPDRVRHRYVRDYIITELPDVAADIAWSELLASRYSDDEADNGHRSQLGGEDYIYKVARLVLKDCYPHLKSLVSRVRSPLLDSPNGGGLRRRLSATTMQVETVRDGLQHLQQYLSELVPPSRDCVVAAPRDVATYFWLFFYGVWRLRIGKLFDDFRKSHGWMDDENAAEQAISSMLLHSLQSLGVALRVGTSLAQQHNEGSRVNAGQQGRA